MRILLVGADKTFSIENYYYNYLTEAGVTVDRFLAQNIFYELYEKSSLSKIGFRLGFTSNIYNPINRLFKKAVETYKPDIVWVFKGMELYPEALHWVKDQRIKLVNYNPDNPFLFSGRGSGNSNITKSIGLYDLHFTYNKEIENEINEKFNNSKVCYLPFGFDLTEETFLHCRQLPEINECCFLGNPDKSRVSFIKTIAQAGIKVNVFGHGWKRFISHDNVVIGDAVYGIRLWEVLRQYRVQLNLMRPHNLNSHNMRTFEIPAVGGVMIAPRTAEHELFFENTKQAFLYRDAVECISLIKEILNFSTRQVQQVRKAAREKSVSAGYSYRERAQQALIHLQAL